ncbi:MAG: glycerol-3-phosphate acyltransferase [Chloroflexi bacterium]|nr:glycerol-3-phosphate acyltransferase [Chloroflexota bacterium]
MAGLQAIAAGVLVLLAAYCLGSLPTALVVSRITAHADIRELGDGNMGARNTARTLGWGPGIFVAVSDFCKGALSVLAAQALGLSLAWQLAAGVCAVLGHDFPIFAGFRGGQGMASILGMLYVLLPVETLTGLAMFGIAYLLSRSFDFSAGISLGSLALLVWWLDKPRELLAYSILLFLTIPVKKAIDWPRRKRLSAAKPAPPAAKAAPRLGHQPTGKPK